MKKYRVTVTWKVTETDSFIVHAESEQDAKDLAIDENDEISEDYDIDRVECMGEIRVNPDPQEVDPNQMTFEV